MTSVVAFVKKYSDEIPVQCRDLDEAKAKRDQLGADAVRIEVDGAPYVEAPDEAPAEAKPKAKKKAEG